MFVIRQSFQADVDQILEVARYLDTINLPADRDRLAEIVLHSERSFAGDLDPFERAYLFVCEQAETGRVVGTSMIHAQHGTRRAPHVFFRVLREEHYSVTLDRYLVHECLRIGYNYNGPTEIGGLILHPDFRRYPEALGKLLSYTRFLYMAMHRACFRDQVLSELLPPLEPDGTSLLWEHLGRHFTGLSYREADTISQQNKEFIHALFPAGLIYTSLLPKSVRAIIGEVGADTRGVEKILRRIGFEYAQQIDPFDGGPHFLANTDELTLIQEARRTPIVDGPAPDHDQQWTVVANEGPRGFRAMVARRPADAGADVIAIDRETRAALDLSDPQEAWWVSG